MGSSGTNRREDRVTLDRAKRSIFGRTLLAVAGQIISNHRRRMLDPTKMGWMDPGNHYLPDGGPTGLGL